MKQINDIEVVVTSLSFSKNESLQSLVNQTFARKKLNLTGQNLVGEALFDFIGNADALVVGLEKVDSILLNACPRLKVIAKFGVGVDNIDLDECRKRGIKVCWTPGVNKRSVAEMVLAFMLMLCRNIFAAANDLKAGKWVKNGGSQLSEKTVGIIGFGSIGSEVAKLLKPFDCKILANDIRDISAECSLTGAIAADKSEIYARADIITVHTPLNASTKYLLNREAFEKMKSTAFIINTSRGGIVNQEDLKYCLKNRIIAGAALDVFESEPNPDNELLMLPVIIGTPHIGGNAREAVEAMGRAAVKHLIEYCKL